MYTVNSYGMIDAHVCAVSVSESVLAGFAVLCQFDTYTLLALYIYIVQL